jgi:hypothetical protein
MKHNVFKTLIACLAATAFLGYYSYQVYSFHTPQSKRLVWHVVATTDLPAGTRITPDHVRLVLDYLTDDVAAFVPTLPLVLNKYTLRCVLRGKPLAPLEVGGELSPKVPDRGAIVPIPVKSEFAEGLSSGMRLRFAPSEKDTEDAGIETPSERATRPTTQDAKSNKASKQNPREPHDSPNGPAPTTPDYLIVELRATLPSQDKTSSILMIGLPASGMARLNELTKPNLIPIIVSPKPSCELPRDSGAPG